MTFITLKFWPDSLALSHRHHSTRTAFGEPGVGTGGNKSITCWQNLTFLKQTDCAVLEPGRPAWQTLTLTIMLFPCPELQYQWIKLLTLLSASVSAKACLAKNFSRFIFISRASGTSGTKKSIRSQIPKTTCCKNAKTWISNSELKFVNF